MQVHLDNKLQVNLNLIINSGYAMRFIVLFHNHPDSNVCVTLSKM